MMLEQPTLTRRACIECGRTMTPDFKSQAPHHLQGWSCKCGWYDKAILRERRFTRADAEQENRR